MIQENLVTKPSPNIGGIRPGKITAIILHDTGGYSAQSAISWFQSLASGVSAHVVIDTDGTIWRMVPDNRVAWHAGRSVLHHEEKCNLYSLGVEIVDADDSKPYPAKQWASVVQWCAWKAVQYSIPLNRIVSHAAIALPPGRKVDPGRDFDWCRFLHEVALAM